MKRKDRFYLLSNSKQINVRQIKCDRRISREVDPREVDPSSLGICELFRCVPDIETIRGMERPLIVKYSAGK